MKIKFIYILAVLIFVGFLLMWTLTGAGYLPSLLEKDVVLVLFGAFIVWVGKIIDFFYRKKFEEKPPSG